jgi:hypothetical protein
MENLGKVYNLRMKEIEKRKNSKRRQQLRKEKYERERNWERKKVEIKNETSK